VAILNYNVVIGLEPKKMTGEPERFKTAIIQEEILRHYWSV
jgi:hypothetical protein